MNRWLLLGNSGSEATFRLRMSCRLPITTALLLAGGIILNLLVAWVCSLVQDPKYDRISTGWAGDYSWARADVMHQDSWCVVLDGRSTVVRWQVCYELPSPPLRPRHDALGKSLRAFGTGPYFRDQVDEIFWLPNVERLAAGWPFESLEYRLVRRTRGLGNCGNSTWAEMVAEHGRQDILLTSGRWTIEGDLPLRTVWPGFAVNTILYATILWLLFPGPFVLRRFNRVRRGLCPACAYPIGESDVCSECGTETSGPCLAAYHGKG